MAAAETKTGPAYHGLIPSELTAYVDAYLRVHRRTLQTLAKARGDAGPGDRLWLGRDGAPLSSQGVRRQIEVRTRHAFGQHVWPHLFRDCAVTELVDSAPDQIGLAPDLLGHARLETTRKHYIQALGMTAHLRVQEVIAKRRRAAQGYAAIDRRRSRDGHERCARPEGFSRRSSPGTDADGHCL